MNDADLEDRQSTYFAFRDTSIWKGKGENSCPRAAGCTVSELHNRQQSAAEGP